MKPLTLSEKKQPLFSDYCQFLLASFHNFTQTYFAEHTNRWSHDQLNRLLREERISAGDLWRSVRNDIDLHAAGSRLTPDARYILLPTIYLNMMLRRRSRNVASAGRLSNFTEN